MTYTQCLPDIFRRILIKSKTKNIGCFSSRKKDSVRIMKFVSKLETSFWVHSNFLTILLFDSKFDFVSKNIVSSEILVVLDHLRYVSYAYQLSLSACLTRSHAGTLFGVLESFKRST